MAKRLETREKDANAVALGRRGGSVKSPRKAVSSAANLAKWRKTVEKKGKQS
jgi:hypothetical protein